MHLQLSPRLQNKVALVAEDSRGPIRVTLVLKSGTRIRSVTVSRSAVIERIGDREVSDTHDLGFPFAEIWDIDLDIAR